MTLDDAFDATPELKAKAVAELKKYRLGPIYTPPSLQGTVALPGVWGGANWGGGAFDPRVRPPVRQDDEQPGDLQDGDRSTSRRSREDRLDEVDAEYIKRSPSSFVDGVPILKPPYAHLVAIDLNRGEIAWKVPFGDAPELRSRAGAQGRAAARSSWRRRTSGRDRHEGRPGVRRRQRHGAVGVRRARRPRSCGATSYRGRPPRRR